MSPWLCPSPYNDVWVVRIMFELPSHLFGYNSHIQVAMVMFNCLQFCHHCLVIWTLTWWLQHVVRVTPVIFKWLLSYLNHYNDAESSLLCLINYDHVLVIIIIFKPLLSRPSRLESPRSHRGHVRVTTAKFVKFIQWCLRSFIDVRVTIEVTTSLSHCSNIRVTVVTFRLELLWSWSFLTRCVPVCMIAVMSESLKSHPRQHNSHRTHRGHVRVPTIEFESFPLPMLRLFQICRTFIVFKSSWTLRSHVWVTSVVTSKSCWSH